LKVYNLLNFEFVKGTMRTTCLTNTKASLLRKVHANLLLRFSNGARGTLWASMAAVGHEHGLRIRVYGDRGSLAWHHEDPHHLRYCPIDGAPQVFSI
jgi:predicted dehydrogenase